MRRAVGLGMALLALTAASAACDSTNGASWSPGSGTDRGVGVADRDAPHVTPSAGGSTDATPGAVQPRRPTPGPDSTTLTPHPAATPKPVRITLLRTGGLAGVRHELVVEPDGRWTYTAGSGRETGRLPQAVTTWLHALAADPRLGAGAGRLPACADGFRYQLTAGAVTVVHNDCAKSSNPVYEEIVRLLAAETPF